MKVIVDAIIEAFLAKVQSLLMTGLMFFIQAFGVENLSLVPYNDGTSFWANFLGVTNLEKISNTLIIVGLSFTVLLFFYHLFTTKGLLNMIVESKTSIIQMIIRLFICVILTFCMQPVFDRVFFFASDVLQNILEENTVTIDNAAYNDIDTYFGLDSGYNDDTQQDSIIYYIASHTEEDGNESNVINDPLFAGADISFDFKSSFLILIVIFRIILFGILAYNFIKLMVEMLRRYVTMNIIYMISSLFPCTFIMVETQNIFLSFVKLFGSSILIFVATKIWVYLTIIMLNNVSTSFINMIVIMSFIVFGLKFEAFFKEIGLSAVNLGGALLDNIAITGMVMGRAISGVTNTAGSAMLNAGGIFGNTALASAGSALTGKPLNHDKVVQAAMDSAGGQLRRHMSMAPGASSNLTPSMKKDIARSFMEGGPERNMAFANKLGGLNAAGYKEAIKGTINMLNPNLLSQMQKHGKLGNYNYSNNKGLGFTLSGPDGIKRNCWISSAPVTGPGKTNIPFTSADGRTNYLNMDSGWQDIEQMKGHTLYGISGEKVGSNEIDSISSLEMQSGINFSPYMQTLSDGSLDTDAAHYAIVPNALGNMDIRYSSTGFTGDALDGDNSPIKNAEAYGTIVGTETYNGMSLRSGNEHFFGSGMTTAYDADAFGKADTSTLFGGSVKPIPAEADFALQFACKGDLINTVCKDSRIPNDPGKTFRCVATQDGPLSQLGQTNIDAVNFTHGQNYISYQYTDIATGQKMKGFASKAIHHQDKATSSNVRGTEYMGDYMFQCKNIKPDKKTS